MPVDTATRLLDAAERLMAAKGVEAVSVRAVNAAADANVAAVHYHFGTKTDLVRAVLERRGADLGRTRARRLAEAGPDPDLRTLIDVAVRPFLELARTDDGATWAGFLAALERAGEPWSTLTQEVVGPWWVTTADALRHSVPGLDGAELAFRLAVVGAIVTGPALAPDAPDIDTVVDVATAAFRASVPADALVT